MTTATEKSKGLELFADRKFGLFIHWGLYSILGRGEWVQRNEKIPAAEYEALRHQFKGDKFDADAVARLFSISCGAGNWFLEKHPKLDPVATMTDGVFVIGCCQGPKDIPDTVAQASAAAARVLALISRGRVAVEAAIASINEDRCSGCRVCNLLCPYNAISYDEAKKVSRVNDVLCKGCGTCVAACPSAAITQKHFTTEQIMAEIEGVLI